MRKNRLFFISFALSLSLSLSPCLSLSLSLSLSHAVSLCLSLSLCTGSEWSLLVCAIIFTVWNTQQAAKIWKLMFIFAEYNVNCLTTVEYGVWWKGNQFSFVPDVFFLFISLNIVPHATWWGNSVTYPSKTNDENGFHLLNAPAEHHRNKMMNTCLLVMEFLLAKNIKFCPAKKWS